MSDNGLTMNGVNAAAHGPVGGVRAMQPEAGDGFVSTAYVEELTQRALTYLEVGYPLHFAGPAGTGKTTLAFHVANNLGRPVILMHGDDEFGSSDLIGRDIGYRKSKLIDYFIHSVLKSEENLSTVRMDKSAHHGLPARLHADLRRIQSLPSQGQQCAVRASWKSVCCRCRGWAAAPKAALPRSASQFPRHLHLQPRGILRRAQDPGRADGPADHHRAGPL